MELISISAHLKEYGKKYVRSFDLVKEHEWDVTYFIDFCLDSLLAGLQRVEAKVNYLIGIADLEKSLGISAQQVALLQRMALNKYLGITIERYARDIGKSREVARKELKGLLERGLLREEKVGKKYLYYVRGKKLRGEVAASRRNFDLPVSGQ